MNIQDRTNQIIDYAKKVVNYPKGTTGYDPLDMENLKVALQKYDQENDSSMHVVSAANLPAKCINNSKMFMCPNKNACMQCRDISQLSSMIG